MTLEYLTSFKLCSDPEAIYLQEEAERNKETTEDPDEVKDDPDPAEVIDDPTTDPDPVEDPEETNTETDITGGNA